MAESPPKDIRKPAGTIAGRITLNGHLHPGNGFGDNPRQARLSLSVPPPAWTSRRPEPFLTAAPLRSRQEGSALPHVRFSQSWTPACGASGIRLCGRYSEGSCVAVNSASSARHPGCHHRRQEDRQPGCGDFPARQGPRRACGMIIRHGSGSGVGRVATG